MAAVHLNGVFLISLHHQSSMLPGQTKAVLASLFHFGLASRRLWRKWQMQELLLDDRRESIITREISPGFRVEIYPAWELNMLAQLKYSSAVRKAAPRTQNLPWSIFLPMGCACSLTYRERPIQALLGVGKGTQGMVGQEAQVVLTAKHLKKKYEGSWKNYQNDKEGGKARSTGI